MPGYLGDRKGLVDGRLLSFSNNAQVGFGPPNRNFAQSPWATVPQSIWVDFQREIKGGQLEL